MRTFYLQNLLKVAVLATLASCGGGGGGDNNAHNNTKIDSNGRLVVTEKSSKTAHVYELNSAITLEARHALEYEPSAIYSSPQGRYAVLMQREKNQVQFLDGGVWQENHGDHLHDYQKASKLASWKIAGARPTHYDVQESQQAAIFMDGNAEIQPPQSATAFLLSDDSISAGKTLASLDLGTSIHGLAEPMDERLLTVSRAADAGDALPTHLNLFLKNGAGYVASRQIPTRCNSMHGSYSSGRYTATGCADGMLIVHHNGPSTVDDGQKVSLPLRIGTIAGHSSLSGHFIGIGTEGKAPAPVTTRFYAVDAATAQATPLVPQGWEEGRIRRAHAFDRSGQRFYVLDDQGTLTIMQRQNNAWTTLSRLPRAIASMPTEAPWPVLIPNKLTDELYLTDPIGKQLVVLRNTGEISTRVNLGYVPNGAAWVGIQR